MDVYVFTSVDELISWNSSEKIWLEIEMARGSFVAFVSGAIANIRLPRHAFNSRRCGVFYYENGALIAKFCGWFTLSEAKRWEIESEWKFNAFTSNDERERARYCTSPYSISWQIGFHFCLNTQTAKYNLFQPHTLSFCCVYPPSCSQWRWERIAKGRLPTNNQRVFTQPKMVRNPVSWVPLKMRLFDITGLFSMLAEFRSQCYNSMHVRWMCVRAHVCVCHWSEWQASRVLWTYFHNVCIR